MPESVTDRPTKSHEYIFLLSKSEKYFYDAEAIKEPCSESTHMRISQNLAEQIGSFRANGGSKTNGPMKAVVSEKTLQAIKGIKNNESFDRALALPVARINKRSVWTVPTESYSGAHFATYPRKLIEPCILAGSRKGDIVLDPFAGSGTTGAVCIDHGRKAILCELKPAYVPLIRERIESEEAFLQPVLF